MSRIIAFVVGLALLALGVVSLIGAVELWQTGADTEALAQSFLVPISLFVIGGFVIWMGSQSGRE